MSTLEQAIHFKQANTVPVNVPVQQQNQINTVKSPVVHFSKKARILEAGIDWMDNEHVVEDSNRVDSCHGDNIGADVPGVGGGSVVIPKECHGDSNHLQVMPLVSYYGFY